MKNMKTKTKIIVGVATFIVLIFVYIFANSIPAWNNYRYEGSSKYMSSSNNSMAFEIFAKYYPSMDEALSKGNSSSKTKISDIKNIVFTDEDKNESIIVYQADNNIVSMEFLTKEENGQKVYRYIGGRVLTFAGNTVNQDADIEETIRTELSTDLGRYLNGLTGLKKKAGRVPAWGVWDSKEVSNLKVDGQPVDSIYEFEYEGKKYYVWYFKALETEKPINDIDLSLQ